LIRHIALCLCACSPLFGQAAAEANKGYQTKEQRAGVASSLSSATRDARQKPKELVAAMNLKPGMTVADLGTGVGYMLPFLSEAVGPSGTVVAQDIFSDFLDQARAKAAKEKLGNVRFVEGSASDAKLERESVDVLLALDAYHHFDYPGKMLASIRGALKPGGRLVIVEYHKNEEAMPNGRALQHIRLTEADAIREIEANGFKLESRRDHIPRVQWMAIFVKE